MTDDALQNCLTVYLKLGSFLPTSNLMTPQSERNDPQGVRLAGVDQDVSNSLLVEGFLYFPIQSAYVNVLDFYLPLSALTRLTHDSDCAVEIISLLIICARCRYSLPAS